MDVKKLSLEELHDIIKEWTEANEDRASIALLTDEEHEHACYIKGKKNELEEHLADIAEEYLPLKSLLKSTMQFVSPRDVFNRGFEDAEKSKQTIN